MPKKDIQQLFHPENVVLVGASDRADHWSRRVYDNLGRFGFSGDRFIVNPKRDALWGQPCFGSVAGLPTRPDHLAIFTPADVTIDLLREGAAAGARTATLYAAGFGEGGSEGGRAMAARLRTVLAQTGILAIGPGCMGLACGETKFCTIPDESLQPLAKSPVALIAQSGAICSSINRAVNELGLQLGYMASVGSQIGCTISDFLSYFARQPELRVILCYIEAVPDGQQFLNAAREAKLNGKTVIVVKVGGSENARASALAHTGSLAGRTEVFDAYAKSAGIVRFGYLEDAIEAVEFLARQPMPRGRKIAALTVSGAVRSLITEAADTNHAHLTTFSQLTLSQLSQTMAQSDVQNPLDTKRTRPTPEFETILGTLIDAPEVDSILIADEPPHEEGTARKISNIKALEAIAQQAVIKGKSISLFSPLLVGNSESARQLRAAIPTVPWLRTTSSAITVLKALSDASGGLPLDPSPYSNDAPIHLVGKLEEMTRTISVPTALSEVASKELLREYGIFGPREQIVRSAEDAASAARDLGFPVVLKGVSPLVPHKSDLGLVALRLMDGPGVKRAFHQIQQAAEKAGVTLDGVLVSEMIMGGIEAVLGLGHDVEMGPYVMVGMGGIGVELFGEVKFAPATVRPDQALALIKGTRLGRLLEGYRGAVPADSAALVNAICAVGRMASDLHEIVEAVDINPLVVLEQGRGVMALDGLVIVRPHADELL